MVAAPYLPLSPHRGRSRRGICYRELKFRFRDAVFNWNFVCRPGPDAEKSLRGFLFCLSYSELVRCSVTLWLLGVPGGTWRGSIERAHHM